MAAAEPQWQQVETIRSEVYDHGTWRRGAQNQDALYCQTDAAVSPTVLDGLKRQLHDWTALAPEELFILGTRRDINGATCATVRFSNPAFQKDFDDALNAVGARWASNRANEGSAEADSALRLIPAFNSALLMGRPDANYVNLQVGFNVVAKRFDNVASETIPMQPLKSVYTRIHITVGQPARKDAAAIAQKLIQRASQCADAWLSEEHAQDMHISNAELLTLAKAVTRAGEEEEIRFYQFAGEDFEPHETRQARKERESKDFKQRLSKSQRAEQRKSNPHQDSPTE